MNRTILLGILILAALGPMAMAGECVDYSMSLEMLGWNADYAPASQVCAEGDRAYVLHGYSLAVYDISDPANPTWVSGPWYVHNAREIAVRDNLVYAACGSGGLRIFDFTDPWDFFTISTLPLPGSLHGLHLVGDLVVVGTETNIYLVDVSDPTAPTHLSSLPNDDWLRAVRRDGDQLGVVNDTSMRLIDIGDPATPVVQATHDFGTYDHAFTFEFLGEHVVVGIYGGWGDDLWFFDRSALSLALTMDLAGSPRGTDLVGDLLYVGTDFVGMEVVDVSDPTAPRKVGHLELGVEYPAVLDFVVHDGLGLIADYNLGLAILDGCSGIIPPHVTATLPRPYGAWCTKLDSDVGMTVNWSNTLKVLDMTSPEGPALLSSLDLEGNGLGLDVLDGVAFVGSAEAGLQAVDCTEPSLPTLLAGVDIPGRAGPVAVAGGLAAVGSLDGQLQCVSVGGEPYLQLLGTAVLPEKVTAVAWSGTRVVCTVGEAGVVVVDAADPSLPTIVGTFPTDDAQDLAVFEDLAYVADGEGGLLVIDLTDPSAPVLVHQFAIPADALTRDGDLLYACDPEHLWGFDLVIPTSPDLIGTYRHPAGMARDLDAGTEGVLMVSSSGATVVTPQCSDGPVATELGWLTAQARGHDSVAVSWQHNGGESAAAYRLEAEAAGREIWTLDAIALGSGRFEAYDRLGAIIGGAITYRLDTWENQSWRHLGTTRIQLAHPAAAPGLLEITPNPFNPQTSIIFELAAPAQVQLAVYDMAGHRVASLIDGHRDAGRHIAVWEGCDENGRTLPSGVYLTRLRADDQIRSGRMTLVR